PSAISHSGSFSPPQWPYQSEGGGKERRLCLNRALGQRRVTVIPIAVARQTIVGQRLDWRLTHSCALLRRDDKAVEERMRARGPALELWVELRADEPEMIF